MAEQKKKNTEKQSERESGRTQTKRTKKRTSHKSTSRKRRATKKSSEKNIPLTREQEVKRLKILIAAVTAVVLILGFFLIHRLLFPVKKGSLTGVSSEVLQYESAMEAACKDSGIAQFSTVMLAMMQQESSGLGTDVMQCSECPFNTEYENVPNAIADPYYSIQVSAEYFAYCLKEAGCRSVKNTERLKLALQDYNFGNSYATWALDNYGSYTVENATEFSLMMQNTLGWSSYGDPEYVDHVLRYYSAP